MEKLIRVSMDPDEDRILLSSLGVTSANPEDIERNILSQVHSLFVFCYFDSCNCIGSF